MSNVIPFRGRAEASAAVPTSLRPSAATPMGRPVLIAVWRPSPVSGRPECRWVCEPRAEDTPSRHIAERRAV